MLGCEVRLKVTGFWLSQRRMESEVCVPLWCLATVLVDKLRHGLGGVGPIHHRQRRHIRARE